MGPLSAARRIAVAGLTLASLAAGEGRASELSSMYDRAVLEHWRPRYARNIEAMMEQAIIPALTADERRQYSKVRFSYPDHDRQRRYFRFSSAGANEIIVPIFVVKFLDDLAIAGAWLAQSPGRSTRALDEYLALLKHRKPEEFPRRRYPTPLAGVGITENVIEHRRVDQAAQVLLKSQVAFLLAREVAELYLINPRMPSEPANPAPDRPTPVKPLNSDLFALEVLRRLGVPPVNVCFYMRAELHHVPTAFDVEGYSGSALFASQVPELLHLHGSLLRRDLASRMIHGRQDFLRFERDKAAAGNALDRCAGELIDYDESVLSARAQKPLRDRAVSAKLGAAP